jgi:hypothetical protein
MIGTTSFAIGLHLSADSGDLLADWERFAMPLRTTPATGGGALPRAGSLLEIGGDAVLSSVRRRDGELEVRLWNPRSERPARATVAGRVVDLSAAQIRTVAVDDPA